MSLHRPTCHRFHRPYPAAHRGQGRPGLVLGIVRPVLLGVYVRVFVVWVVVVGLLIGGDRVLFDELTASR